MLLLRRHEMVDNEEIEAVARAIYPQYEVMTERRLSHAVEVIAALDAVRERSSQGDDHEVKLRRWKQRALEAEADLERLRVSGTEPDIPGITSCIDCGRRLVRGECPVCEADLGTEPGW
jgi:hypothetical protein